MDTIDKKAWPPMTRGDLAETVRVMGMWADASGRFIVVRLVTEVHRLRLKTRLQRRTIAEQAAEMAARPVMGSLPDVPALDPEAKPIRNAEDLFEAFGAALEGGELKNVLSFEDQGEQGGGYEGEERTFSVVFSDGSPPVTLTLSPWSKPVAPTEEVPRG